MADLIYLSLVSLEQSNDCKDQESRTRRGLNANTTPIILDSASICVPGDAPLECSADSFLPPWNWDFSSWPGTFGPKQLKKHTHTHKTRSPPHCAWQVLQVLQVTTLSAHLQESECRWPFPQGLQPFWSTTPTKTLREFLSYCSRCWMPRQCLIRGGESYSILGQ